jgi:hypothetical protein
VSFIIIWTIISWTSSSNHIPMLYSSFLLPSENYLSSPKPTWYCIANFLGSAFKPEMEGDTCMTRYTRVTVHLITANKSNGFIVVQCVPEGLSCCVFSSFLPKKSFFNHAFLNDQFAHRTEPTLIYNTFIFHKSCTSLSQTLSLSNSANYIPEIRSV